MNNNFLNSFSIDSIKNELRQYVEDSISNYDCLDEDLHNELFNSDYYLIGYQKCEKWLNKHYMRLELMTIPKRSLI